MPKLGMEAIRRRQIIDAVLKILSTQGWRDLTIREVSEVAGVSTGVITHYFSSKRTMTIDAISEAYSRMADALRRIERLRASPSARLVAVVGLLVDRESPTIGWPFWLAILGRMPFDRMIQSEADQLHQRFVELIVSTIEQGAAQGDFTPRETPESIATRVVALAYGLGALMVADPSRASAESCRREMLVNLELDLNTPLAPRMSGHQVKQGV